MSTEVIRGAQICDAFPQHSVLITSVLFVLPGQHTSILRRCSINQRPVYQPCLSRGKFVGKFARLEPHSLLNLKTKLVSVANCLTRKNYFDLPGPFECSCGNKFQFSDFKANLFTQFAAECFVRLFSFFKEAARQTPAAARAKAMFEQQNAAAGVGNNRTRRNGKARMPKFDSPAPQCLWSSPPECTEKIV